MDKEHEQIVERVREGGWSIGRLSSALGAPDMWRGLIEETIERGWVEIKSGVLVVSSEDVEARQLAMKFADAHTPMALEHTERQIPPSPEKPKPALKRKRRSAEEIAADKAAKEAARAMAKLHTEALRMEAARAKAIEKEAAKVAKVEERERLRQWKIDEKLRLKQEAQAQKLREAEGGQVQLPAVVMRNGYVGHVSDHLAKSAHFRNRPERIGFRWHLVRRFEQTGLYKRVGLAGIGAEWVVLCAQDGVTGKH